MLEPCGETQQVITVLNGQEADARLASGLLACPDCQGPLAPWGFARSRVVQGLADKVRLRPRRTICTKCHKTHVMQPPELVARRAVSMDVIGLVLLDAATGAGHRSIAASRGLAVGTVRNWLRRFRANVEPLRTVGTIWAVDLDPEPAVFAVFADPLTQALDALGRAAAAAIRFCGPSIAPNGSVWQLIALLTRGRLLAPPNRSG